MSDVTTSTCAASELHKHRTAQVTGTRGAVASICAETLAADGWRLCDASSAEGDTATWRVHVAGDADVTATLEAIRSFAARLPPDARGGVVLVLDVTHWQPRGGDPAPPFAAAFGQQALWLGARMLALELAPRLRINGIGLPGLQDAPTPPGPADIAAALRFVIDAPALTGQMIALDGGRTALVPTPGLEP